MKKINTTPPSGTHEFLPETQVVFDQVKAKIAQTFARHGYLRIKTPSIDRLEILLAKAGGDTEKQIYKVIKTAESSDKADQGLRFDHTVPLARYVVEHENDLTFPFKVSQVDRNWRGERAQKGRYREFYQCDVDVIGRGKLDLAYDVDIISTLLDTYTKLKLGTPVLAHISNRKILTGLLNSLNISDQAEEVLHIIDRSDKMPPEAVEASLVDLGLPDSSIKAIKSLIDINGARLATVSQLNDLKVNDPIFQAGVAELDRVMELLEAEGLDEQITADLKIVRGLDYYTGTVFEFGLPEYSSIGSIGGGGRYENLAGHFTDQILPGVGGSIGLSRLFYILSEQKLLSFDTVKPVDYAVIPMQDDHIPFALKVAKKLRFDQNSATIVFLGDKKLGDKLTYASKIARKAIVVGENEVATGEYKIKTFK